MEDGLQLPWRRSSQVGLLDLVERANLWHLGLVRVKLELHGGALRKRHVKPGRVVDGVEETTRGVREGEIAIDLRSELGYRRLLLVGSEGEHGLRVSLSEEGKLEKLRVGVLYQSLNEALWRPV